MNASLSPFGYDNDPKTYDEFQQMVSVTTDAKNGASFALGDLYIYGETNFHETYTQAFDDTQVQLVTIQNYARVCRAFPRPRRKYNVSFGHYDTVRTLPPEAQDNLLSRAELKKWNRDDLRKARHDYEGTEKPESIKTTCKVIDLANHLMNDYGLSPDDMIDITAKIVEIAKEGIAA